MIHVPWNPPNETLTRIYLRHKTGFAGFGILLALYIALKALAWLIPLPQETLFKPSSTLVFDRNGKLLHGFIAEDDGWRFKTPLSKISPNLQRAVLGYEDRWFYFHPGVNPLAMVRAMGQNFRSGHVVSGGSTMTMQIARMMEPKSRTLANKLWEAFRAFQLELRYSKRELLEVYFNSAPYGGNIEGAAAAAWFYLGKEPTQLSWGEAALLTALPNSPTQNRPDVNLKRAVMARNRVLARLKQHGIISDVEYREAVREEIFQGRQSLPRQAPHFCRDLFLDYPEMSRLETTLDSQVQSMAEDILRLHLKRCLHDGITNGAIVVIDNKSHEVLAMVGSGDFHEKLYAGEVNGARAPRSPGSALKPFIYALAMQEGLISPAHYLEDVPTDFSGYAPENFDQTFCGVVSARAALERSLNLPAVSLEHQLGDKGLYSLLEKADVTSLRSRDNYGLSIAIGGCEISLLDLTALYSVFASGGIFVRPRQLRTEPLDAGIRLMDSGTAYIITDILTGLRRPDMPTCWEFTSLPRAAWKTGTSYGHRDAWSVGYNPLFTVGVWLGNFAGEGAKSLVGAEVAAPILFEVMNNLCRGRSIPWFSRPSSVGIREVCSLSGQFPGEDCPSCVEEIYLKDRAPDEQCTFHVAVEIDDATGYRLPPKGAGNRPSHRQVFRVLPPRVGAWMERSGTSVQKLPALLPEWQGTIAGNSPIIRSPSLDCRYRLREGVPAEVQKICLEASAGNDVQKLFWFVDGVFLGSARSGQPLFYVPTVGKHRVVCQDDMGRSTDFILVVEGADL